MFKNNTTDLLSHMFCEGEGGSRFLRDPKGGTSLELRGGVTFFLSDPKGRGGSKKSCKPK